MRAGRKMVVRESSMTWDTSTPVGFGSSTRKRSPATGQQSLYLHCAMELQTPSETTNVLHDLCESVRQLRRGQLAHAAKVAVLAAAVARASRACLNNGLRAFLASRHARSRIGQRASRTHWCRKAPVADCGVTPRACE